MQSSAVIIDPIVYILCHAKYRKAIKKLLNDVTGDQFSLFDTDGEVGSTNVINKSHKITTMEENESLPRLTMKKIIKLNVKAETVSLDPGLNSVNS